MCLWALPNVPKMRIYADSPVIAVGMRCHSTQAPLRLHEKCISLAQILRGSGLSEGLLLERDECRWRPYWRDAKHWKNYKGGKNSVLKRWGMMECCSKRGQNCNNSCRLLRNTECFPAIWINKHSLKPLRPRLSFSPNGCIGVPSAALSNMLPINSDERGNNCKFEIPGFGNSSFGSKAVVLYQPSCHLCVSVDTTQPGQHVSALLIRSPWWD